MNDKPDILATERYFMHQAAVVKRLRSISDDIADFGHKRLRNQEGRGADDPWGFCFWIYHIDESVQKQSLGGLPTGNVGLTFDLADLFANGTVSNE